MALRWLCNGKVVVAYEYPSRLTWIVSTELYASLGGDLVVAHGSTTQLPWDSRGYPMVSLKRKLTRL